MQVEVQVYYLLTAHNSVAHPETGSSSRAHFWPNHNAHIAVCTNLTQSIFIE